MKKPTVSAKNQETFGIFRVLIYLLQLFKRARRWEATNEEADDKDEEK